MSVRGFTPIFKWGFGLRRSNYLVPLISNNIVVSGEEAVAQQFQPAFSIPTPSRVKEIRDAPVSVLPVENVETNKRPLQEMEDEEIIKLVAEGKILAYRLEQDLKDNVRAVEIRRKILEQSINNNKGATQEPILETLPFESFDYSKILGSCCENVIGYVPIPVGVAGPLQVNGELVNIPMATTEGCLVASTHRGCKAISSSGGANSYVLSKGMTRAPVVAMPSATRAVELKNWLEQPHNYARVEEEFNSTSRYGKLQSIKVVIVGKNVYLRFKSDTGDAMGMNIVGKGCEKALEYLQDVFEDMRIMSLSGNYCTDKKPSSVNWTEGRGRSVVAEATIKKHIVENVLKTSVKALVELNTSKNLIGSAMAGSIGGFNAHAANIVTAVFLATGQDPAQNVESSNCITVMESTEEGDLYISVTMPSLEVGTVGGGTFLPAQSSCLNIMGVKGASQVPGENADQLARIICSAVLAGELSLMSALAAGHLMKSHLKYNRKAGNS